MKKSKILIIAAVLIVFAAGLIWAKGQYERFREFSAENAALKSAGELEASGLSDPVLNWEGRREENGRISCAVSSEGKECVELFIVPAGKTLFGETYEVSAVNGLISCRTVMAASARTEISGTPADNFKEEYGDFFEGAVLKEIGALCSLRQLSAFLSSGEKLEIEELEAGIYYAFCPSGVEEEEASGIRAGLSREIVLSAGSGIEIKALRVSRPYMLDGDNLVIFAQYVQDGKSGGQGVSERFCMRRSEDRWVLSSRSEDCMPMVDMTEQSVYKPPAVSAAYPYSIKVNRLMNTVTVYMADEHGDYSIPFKAMVCSTGKPGSETPLGEYTIQNFKAKWCYMVDGSYGQYATRIVGGILFHSVCYTAKDKSKLMVEEYNMLGGFASLGCVRLQTADAKWIFDNCAVGTPVSIYESEEPGPLGKPDKLVHCIDPENNNGWDPTDPDPANPWVF